jgi:hypothetical protein
MEKFRAKFRLSTETKGEGEGKKLTFYPVQDTGIPEDQQFHKYTPSGTLEMFVTNQAILESVKPGDQFYIDFTPIKQGVKE